MKERDEIEEIERGEKKKEERKRVHQTDRQINRYIVADREVDR